MPRNATRLPNRTAVREKYGDLEPAGPAPRRPAVDDDRMPFSVASAGLEGGAARRRAARQPGCAARRARPGEPASRRAPALASGTLTSASCEPQPAASTTTSARSTRAREATAAAPWRQGWQIDRPRNHRRYISSDSPSYLIRGTSWLDGETLVRVSPSRQPPDLRVAQQSCRGSLIAEPCPMAETTAGPSRLTRVRSRSRRAQRAAALHPRAVRARGRAPEDALAPGSRAAARSTPRWPSSTPAPKAPSVGVAARVVAAARARAPAVARTSRSLADGTVLARTRSTRSRAR